MEMENLNISTIPDFGLTAVQDALKNSGVLEAYNELQKTRELLASMMPPKIEIPTFTMPSIDYLPTFTMSKELVELSKKVAEMNHNAAQMATFNSVLVNQSVEAIRHVTEQYKNIVPSTLEKRLAQVVADMSNTYQYVAESTNRNIDFYPDISKKENVQNSDTNSSNSLVNEIKEKLIAIEKNGDVAEKLNTQRFRVSILLSFLMFLYPLLEKYFSVTEIEKLQLDINKLQKTQNELLILLQDSLCKITTTKATVTTKPKSKGQRIDSLYPKQLVFMLDTSKKWMNIQFISPKSGQTKEGWILKKTVKSF